jgi:hypothetical protein
VQDQVRQCTKFHVTIAAKQSFSFCAASQIYKSMISLCALLS